MNQDANQNAMTPDATEAIKRAEREAGNILFVVPTTGSVAVPLTQWITIGCGKLRCDCVMVDDRPVTLSRTSLVGAILDSNAEWSLWVDSDTLPYCDPLTMIGSALALNAPVVLMQTAILRDLPKVNISPPLVELVIGSKIPEAKKCKITIKDQWPTFWLKWDVPVMQGGFGAALIHRSVFENVPRPWFNDVLETDPNGQIYHIGEDVYFVSKCWINGFPVWSPGSVYVGHMKSIVDLGKLLSVSSASLESAGRYPESLGEELKKKADECGVSALWKIHECSSVGRDRFKEIAEKYRDEYRKSFLKALHLEQQYRAKWPYSLAKEAEKSVLDSSGA